MECLIDEENIIYTRHALYLPLKITRVLLYAIYNNHAFSANGHDRVHIFGGFFIKILIIFHLISSSYIPVYTCMGM